MTDADSNSRIVVTEMSNAYVAAVQVPLTQDVLDRFCEDLLAKIKTSFLPNLILDFSGLDLMDRSEFNGMNAIAKMAYLMGVDSYFVKLNPHIAASLVQMGVEVDEIKTALNLEDAFAAIESKRTG